MKSNIGSLKLKMRDIMQDPMLREYLANVRRWHGYVRFLGLPDRRDNPDILIDRLFVEPLLLKRYVSPEDTPSVWNDQTDTVFDVLEGGKPLIVLGDPGSGKSTLLNYIVWTLARPTTGTQRLKSWLLPIPIVLRELLLKGVDNFESLLRVALDHPMFQPLRTTDYLHRMLMEGRALVLLDGIDEVGDISARRELRQAIIDGFTQFPDSRWLLTSRIVGYDEVPFDRAEGHDKVGGDSSFEFGEKISPGISTLNELQLQEPADRGKERQEITSRRVATIRYMAPFDNSRIDAFARNWYSQREAAATRAGESAAHLVQAVHADGAILRLARVPNLLTMMALIHRIEANLPHGRALLYDRIAEAYLESIDRYRGVYSGAYNLAQKRKWLARIGYEVQRKRASHVKDTSEEVEPELLIQKDEVISWVEEEMSQSAPEAFEMSAPDFLDIVGRRSGLFLPRGQDRYAFVHLSFQEYFAAVALEQEVTGLHWARGNTTRLGLKRDTVQELAGQITWFETFSFLFELLASKEDWHSDLLQVVFGDNFVNVVEKRIAADDKTPLDLTRLLTRLLSNPLSGFPNSKKVDAMSVAVQSAVQYGALFELSAEVFSELLTGDEEWDRNVVVEIGRQIRSQDAFYLDLSNTKVSDLSPLPPADSLLILDLDNTHTSDVRPLEKLSSLQRVYMSNTFVVDITPLSNLRHLKTLHLSNTPIEDIGPLSNLEELQRLMLNNGQISDISPLEGLFELEHLTLTNTAVRDLSPLRNLSKLQSLGLAGTNVSDIFPLAKLIMLQSLVLWNTKISNLEPLCGMKRLKKLDLDSTRVQDLAPISALSALETLELRDAPVSDISALANLPSLRVLKLWNTQVSDIEPLSQLTSLVSLDLDGTKVSDIRPLRQNKGLESLDLRNLDLSKSSVEELRKALPDCNIFV